MQFIESSVIGVRSAVLTLGRRASPLRFVLFPMVHVAEPAFYREVADRARGCALVVAEGGPAGTAPVQERMARIRFDGLVDQVVGLDLAALGRPVLWEYERGTTRESRLASAAGDTLSAVALRALGRYADPRHLPSLDESDDHDDRWEGGRFARKLRDVVIDRRDQRLVATLAELHRQHHDEAVTIAVVYGARHMPAVVEYLRAEFGYQVKDAEWLMVRSAPC